MDILKQELALKRKAVEEIRSVRGKKFLPSSELHNTSRSGNKPITAPPTQDPNDTNEQTPPHTSPKQPMESSAVVPTSSIPRAEVIRRLRERSEPIILFGETEHESMNRLKQLEMRSPEGSSGLQNDFLKAIERLDREYIESLVIHPTGDTHGAQSRDVAVTSSEFTYAEVQSLSKELNPHRDTGMECGTILNVLQFLMASWGRELNCRSSSVKASFEGKKKSAIYRQTISYMQPLLRNLRKKRVSSDILCALKKICIHLMELEYIKANDAYLDMAIGNEAWPIGVTMVGIHARTGREKIFANKVAHVLNDETQRKYIQGLKRLMSYCQKKYPTDPSKSIEYSTDLS